MSAVEEMVCVVCVVIFTLLSFYFVCCSDCVGVCGNVCCVAAVVKNGVFEPWSVEVCCVFV